MYKTISESINFTSLEEFEQSSRYRALEYTTHEPISIVTKSYEKDNFYWCQILLVDSTSIVRKYIFTWDIILHDWTYAWDIFTLVITD